MDQHLSTSRLKDVFSCDGSSYDVELLELFLTWQLRSNTIVAKGTASTGVLFKTKGMCALYIVYNILFQLVAVRIS